MPVPTPNTGENENDFINRCVSFLVDEGTDQEQAVAICYTQWEDKNMLFDSTKFKTKKELFNFLIENKEQLIAQKRAIIKHADGIGCNMPLLPLANKALSNSDKSEISVKAIINTTNVLDSHNDLHIPGIWDKSLSENKRIMHIQEHTMRFDKIISDGEDLKAYVQDYTFKELGYDLEGKTQALVFDSTIKESRNSYMFDAYKKGYVNNHSVGMQYIKLALAVDDDEWGSEKEVWDKYYPLIANKSKADEIGYFWVVKEAKVIEGSAVPIGSNTITPTLEVKNEPLNRTQYTEPLQDTLTKEDIINAFKQARNG